METVKIERHSEKHYTIRGKSMFGNEIIIYSCSNYLPQQELYDKVDRKEATDLHVLCRLENESDEEMHHRLKEEVFKRASTLMANTPIHNVVSTAREPPKRLSAS